MGNVLNELIELFGVSGREEEVRKYIKKKVAPHVDDIKVDRMGNLIAHKKGKGPKVMVSAHMDEIGLMVRKIDHRGFIYCSEMGGIDPIAFIGNPIHIKTKKGIVHGFITTAELSVGKYIEKLPTIDDMFIDTGMSKKDVIKMGVEIGAYCYLESNTCCTGKNKLIFGKALDNRIGCYALIQLVKELKRSKGDVYFVFSVQEEFGMFGAKTSSWEIEPDWGIVIDTTYADDAFTDPSRWIGKGPCITVKDGEFLSNACIVDWLKTIAKKRKIPYQLEAAEEGTTDASIIQTTKGGVPTAVLSIPVRNVHTSSGIAHMDDVNNTVRLLSVLLKNPPVKCIK